MWGGQVSYLPTYLPAYSSTPTYLVGYLNPEYLIRVQKKFRDPNQPTVNLGPRSQRAQTSSFPQIPKKFPPRFLPVFSPSISLLTYIHASPNRHACCMMYAKSYLPYPISEIRDSKSHFSYAKRRHPAKLYFQELTLTTTRWTKRNETKPRGRRSNGQIFNQ